MVQVILEEKTRIEWAVKEFRRKVNNAGILEEYRRRCYAEKPSVAKKSKIARARKRRSIARKRRLANKFF